MIVAAHQPNFLPWLGYLDKVRKADLFVLVDHVQFERQNFQNRTRIKTRSGPQWLTVPVHRGSQHETIVEKRIDNKPDGRISWGERLYRTLRHAYGKTPYFEVHQRFFSEMLTRRWTHLVDLNVVLLRYLLRQFGIDTPLVWSSQLVGIEGRQSQMIATMCEAVGADVYLSGMGGSRRYLQSEMFGRRGIEVRWQRFEHPRYPQISPPLQFLPRMSAVDLLFNCGPGSAAILRGARPVQPARDAALEVV